MKIPLYKRVKDLSFEIMDYTDNIPRHLNYIRNYTLDTFHNIVRILKYYAVNRRESLRIKEKYLKDLLAELSVLDYYLECLYKKGVLGSKKYNYFSSKLDEIIKISCGVVKNEKEQSKV